MKPKEFVFTVNDEGKKVKFSPGNLYWDGSEFKFEEHQYDYPATWDPNHVGLFFWSKDAAIAVTETYSDDSRTRTDKFFAADGGAIAGWTVLSADEWQYLMDHSLHTEIREEVKLYWAGEAFAYIGTYEQAKAAFEAKYPVYNFDELYGAGSIAVVSTISRNIAGVNCIILKSDGFEGTIKESYTASEWAEAEKSGLVALPFSGAYINKNFFTGNSGDYWSSATSPDTVDAAFGVEFGNIAAYVVDNARFVGWAVRLVSVQ